MKTVGIIGFGSFGKFVAEKLDGHCKVLVNSRGNEGKWAASLKDVAKADFIVPCIPVSAYEKVLEDLKSHLNPQAVIVDISSIKEKPIELIQKHLPNQALVATHPLFGPESAQDSLEGHVMVMCPEVSDQAAYKQIEKFSQKLGMKVMHMSAEEHDKEMAVVQGLTFFIARALSKTGIHHQALETPSFRRLLHLAELEAHHSDDLFQTIQSGNRFTKEIRQKFIDAANELSGDIE